MQTHQRFFLSGPRMPNMEKPRMSSPIDRQSAKKPSDTVKVRNS